jgi:hypothetical protein
MRSSTFWGITRCSLLKAKKYFGKICRLLLHGRRISQTQHVTYSLSDFFLFFSKDGRDLSLRKITWIWETTRRYIPEDIECSFCRLTGRPEHLISRHWYLPANWRPFIRWSPDQGVSQCYATQNTCPLIQQSALFLSRYCSVHKRMHYTEFMKTFIISNHIEVPDQLTMHSVVLNFI